MATATKTSLKNWICAASNFIALIPSRLILRMLPKFFWSWNLKDCIKVQKKKKKVVVFCSPSSTKREIRKFHVVVVQRRQRNVQKKRDARAKLLFCLSKPTSFLPFSLPSSLRKLRIVPQSFVRWWKGTNLLPSPPYITARSPQVWPLLIYSHILSHRFNPIRSQLETVLGFWLVNVCMKECELIKGGNTFRLLALKCLINFTTMRSYIFAIFLQITLQLDNYFQLWQRFANWS